MPDDGRPQTPTTNMNAETPARTRRRVNVRILFILVIAALAIGFTGRWGYWQWAHVSETDARVKADTIAVSSRVSGWVVDLPIVDGDVVREGDLLVEIDSRESRLKLTEYGARIAVLAAERQQITSEIDLIDRTTASHVEAVRSRADAALVARLARQLSSQSAHADRACPLQPPRAADAPPDYPLVSGAAERRADPAGRPPVRTQVRDARLEAVGGGYIS